MTPPNMEDLLALHLTELGLHFVRQYAYSPPRKFRADFAVWWRWRCGRQEGCRLGDRLCLIEVTGGIWTHQAHSSRSGVLKDNERLWHAFRAHWPMVRFTPQQVESGEAKAMVEAALRREA